MNKKVLIISYTFPPFPGIGGRRWAKFAKYLVRKKYSVHVLCAKNPYKKESLWMKDIADTNIRVNALPLKYPNVMFHGAVSIWDKLLYRFWKIVLSFYSKGVVFERTVFWQKQLLEKTSVLIREENITNVIVSIPPYKLAAYSVELKQRFPEINLIIDYRDPWTDNKSFHGFENISSKRFAYEEQMEKKVLTTADCVITVSDEMTKKLKAREGQFENIVTIPNGYDPDDIVEAVVREQFETDKLRFIYGGTLYSNLDYIIDPLLAYLNKLKQTNRSLYNKISFEFYGEQNPDIVKKIKDFNSQAIFVNKELPLNELFRKLKEGTFCVLMSAPDHSFAFNTKFFEYLANRKPILLFSHPGDTANFIINNKLGAFIDPMNMQKELGALFNNIESEISKFNSNFDIKPYSVPYLTGEVEKLLR